MTWWGVLLIGLGCYWLGFLCCALLAAGKAADERMERLMEGGR